MESTNETAEIKPKNMYVPICIAQSICIGVILISILIIKLFFKDTYIKLGEWCKESVLEPTQVTELLQEETVSED